MFIAKFNEGIGQRMIGARVTRRRAGPLCAAIAGLCFTVPAAGQAPVPGSDTGTVPAAGQAPVPGSDTATVAPAAPATGAAAGSVAPRFAEVLAQPNGLTSNVAARRAAETSVQAAIERQDVRIAEDAKATVLWSATPRLTLTGRATRLSPVDAIPEFPQLDTNYSVAANLTVPLSDYLLKLVQVLRGANASRAAAQFDEHAARVISASNAKLAYYDWVRTRLETVVSEQGVSEASAQLARMKALFSVGRAAQADLLQAQAFEADAQFSLSQSRTRGRVAEERLRLSMHARPDEPLSVGEDVLAEFGAKEEPSGLEELYREALAARLELRSFEKKHSALEDSRSVEAASAWPTLQAVGNVTYANPNQRIFPTERAWHATWDVGLQLTWSINDFGVAGRRADTVGAQVVQLEQQRISVEEALRVEIVSALGALNEARENVGTTEQGERAAAAAYEARARLQEQGMGTALELMQAETARIRARLNLVYAHIALRVARTQLDHAVGRDVPNELRNASAADSE